MTFKAFRPPAFVQPGHNHIVESNDVQPASKKRRISGDHKQPVQVAEGPVAVPDTRSNFRTPLANVKNIGTPMGSQQNGQTSAKNLYSALWRKVTNKKHKTWDGDGTVIYVDGYASLKNDKGKYMGRRPLPAPPEPGDMLSIGGMDVEIDNLLHAGETPSSQPDVVAAPTQVSASTASFRVPSVTPASIMPAGIKLSAATFKTVKPALPRPVQPVKMKPFVSSAMPPVKLESLDPRLPVPKYDPAGEGALVMIRPKSVPQGRQIVDVVVDPFLCRKLRDHQRQGVAFMYECVMGMRCREGCGAILADEMGLGKTLQTIALIWTLLKQNPIYGEPPVIRKAVIICPASVVRNWRKEFRKWLGSERVGVLALSEDQKRISSFTRGNGKVYQVLVLSYEMFNSAHKDLQKCKDIDIVIADEGHRLKTVKNKTIAAVNALGIERRIVLTGTLLQNDYSEWYSVVDFVNPGFLGKYSIFKRDFENPILRSRLQGASQEDLDRGDEADRELKAQTGSFIIRRTADILSKYLPGKTEFILLCRPTELQAEVYQSILGCGALDEALGQAKLRLPWINILKKACNSPSLLLQRAEKSAAKDDSDTAAPSLLSRIAERISSSRLRTGTTSGKLRALDSLLHTIHHNTDEKVVIMSNYTTTLDIIANLLASMDYTFLRLDGSTLQKHRQDLVDRFNAASPSRCFVFLMSTKAGGVGINLIGASRLILFDADWNPANDAQAMARICRDGQKRPCFIYRLMAKGAIEERIFQRQIVKMGLADSVVDGKAGGADSFSREEVRDLFRFDQGDGCMSHEGLGCDCAMDGSAPRVASASTNDAEVAEVADANDSDDDMLPPIKNSSFITATQFDARERSSSPKKKDATAAQHRGLMLYSHLDTRALREKHNSSAIVPAPRADADGGHGVEVEAPADETMEDEEADPSRDNVEDDENAGRGGYAIRDEILRRVVLEEGSAVDFVFAKSSGKADPAAIG